MQIVKFLSELEGIKADYKYSVVSVTPDTLLVCGCVLYDVNGRGKTLSALHSNMHQS
jgi:hypothetical protein